MDKRWKCIKRLRIDFFWTFEEGNIIDEKQYDRMGKDQQSHFQSTEETGNVINDFDNNRKKDESND